MWGPGGGSLDFGYSDSVGLGPLSFGYDFGAGTGTVSARFPGTLSVDYAPIVSPGTTSLGFSFLGNGGGGQLKSDFGAWAHVWASALITVDIVNENYALNIDRAYTPRIDQQVSGSASTTLGSVGLDVIVASAGADVDIEQADYFTATGINGVLGYTLRGSGSTNLMPVSLATDVPVTMDLTLTEPGIWDFWFSELTLANTFSLAFDVELALSASTAVGCGVLWLESCHWRLPLADIGVYDGSPFPLAFDTISGTQGFSIDVGTTPVPEPGTLSLLAVGLASITGLVRCTRARGKHRR
jgi:hypothetical protein